MKNLFRGLAGIVLMGAFVFSPFVKAEGPVVAKANNGRLEETLDPVKKRKGEIYNLLLKLESELQKKYNDNNTIKKTDFVPSSFSFQDRHYKGLEYTGDKNFLFSFLFPEKSEDNSFLFHMSSKGDNKGLLRRVIDRVSFSRGNLEAGLDDRIDRIEFVQPSNSRSIHRYSAKGSQNLAEIFYLAELNDVFYNLLNTKLSERPLDKLVKPKPSSDGYSPQVQKTKRYDSSIPDKP
jgi:hypothetical protein